MNRRILKFVPLLALAGCISVDCGYAPNAEIACEGPSRAAEKVPVTFSIRLECPMMESPSFAPTADSLRTRVQSALMATQRFSTVQYLPSIPHDTYHIAFDFHIGGATADSETVAALVSGCSLGLIPVWTWATFDGSATASLRGENVFAWGAAEKMCIPIWLPLAPIGLFWNCAVGWDSVEKGVVNAIVNELSAFHQTRFLED